MAVAIMNEQSVDDLLINEVDIDEVIRQIFTSGTYSAGVV